MRKKENTYRYSFSCRPLPISGYNALWISVLLVLFNISQVTSQDYKYDKWESKDGLAQNSVKVLIQSQDGYLWMSTEGGLSRFDGVQFKNYNVDSDTTLKSNRMGVLFENSNGDLLFWNYRAGFICKRGERFMNLSSSISQKDTRIKRIIPCSENILLLENYSLNTSFIDRNNYERLPQIDIGSIRSLRKVITYKDYNLWVYKDSVAFKDNSCRPIPTLPTITSPIEIKSLAFDQANQTIWTIEGDTLFKRQNFEITASFYIDPNLGKGSHKGLTFTNNNLFLSFSRSSVIYQINQNTGVTSLYSDEQDICQEGLIFRMLIDREGNVWFATSACGLIKMKSPRIKYLDKDSWDIKRNLYPIVKDSADNVFLGGSQSGILQIDASGELVHDSVYNPVKHLTVNSIAFHKGDQYFSSYKANHLWKRAKNKNSLTKIFFPDSIHDQKNTIYSCKTGELIIPSDYGYFRLLGNHFEDVPVLKKKKLGFISNFFESTDGLLWIASGNQLLAFNRKTKTIAYDSNIEVPDIKGFREIIEDEEGRILVGTYEYGFIVIEGKNTFHITRKEGLIENVVSTITEDSWGNIWLTGNKGLSRIKKKDMLELIEGKRNSLNVVLYNEQTDRFRSSEFNGGQQQAKCKLDTHCYLFPSLKGAVMVDFSKMQGTQNPPEVLIESLHYNNRMHTIEEDLKTDYTGERLEIRYTSTSFISSPQIRFKYRLMGYNDNWVDAGTERKTSYSKIPPGDYEFQVMAQSHEGVWNEQPARFAFSIVPPFYLTNWAIAGAIILGIILLILTVNKLNSQKIKILGRRQELQLEAIIQTEEKERKRFAKDLHDGVGQLLSRVKINLGLANSNIEENKTEIASDLVQHSKSSIEEIMSELRNISYNLLPPSLEHFGLGVAIAEELSKFNNNPNIHIHFDNATGESRLKPNIELVFFRVYQELLNNVLKHANAKEVTIQLIQHEKSFMLIVEDDGEGFDYLKSIRKLNSSGLKNIYSRVKYMKGTIRVDSQKGKGTHTTIEIPLKK